MTTMTRAAMNNTPPVVPPIIAPKCARCAIVETELVGSVEVVGLDWLLLKRQLISAQE